MKAYMCVICGFVYEEAKGHPESGLPPGTKWEDVPLNWHCPDCGAGKEDFEMIEVDPPHYIFFTRHGMHTEIPCRVTLIGPGGGRMPEAASTL